MKYVTVEEMIAIEKESNAAGHTYSEMMEHAGRGLAEVVHEEFADFDENTALGLVGSGNNGGDTLVASCYLQEWGWQTTAYIVRPRPKDDPLLARAQAAGVEILNIETDVKFKQLNTALEQHDVLLDGVLGTGIELPLRGAIAKTLEFVQKALFEMDVPPLVVAVDCPSGVDCDSGAAAPQCLPADLTVTMAAVKRGLLQLPAYDLVGELVGVEIGLPEGLPAQDAIRRAVVTAEWVSEQLPERPSDAHKGTFGTALVVAGSMEFSGALALAGEAAYRSGAGLVTLGAAAPLHSALAGSLPEATWLLLPHEKGVIAAVAADTVRENLERVTALLLGPGFGMADTTGEFLKRLFGDTVAKKSGSLGFVKMPETESRKENHILPPLIIDADGLKLLAKLPDWAARLPKPAVLTPHPGEMSALTGLETAEIQADRLSIAERFAAEWGQVIVLKGAFTVIAAPDGRTMIIPVASSALARAGSGDVLAGLIAGLRAQGMEAFEAAAAGAWIHAQAGLLAAEMQGNTATVLAGDLLNVLPDVLEQLL
ncbi:MAG: NAD(P)H-hydrate dehydratase [Chloroflexi bacterium]|jgi:ADP-dependent NAD(P)H-hydrate dehydratase / NAD(P)H-hydrate epimerase|nr:NAD(P)H-hydrate dehydratase [Chloroflexota bacterium]